jgi:endonuclease-3
MVARARAAEEIPPTRPFDIDVAVERLREAVRDLPKAAMFALADEGYDSLFEQLVA